MLCNNRSRLLHSTQATADESYGSIQRIEANKLVRLLRRYLLHHDISKAADVMDVLMSQVSESGEVIMKCSREILLYDMDVTTLQKLLKFQRVATVKFRIENTLERIFLLTHCKSYDEAYQLLLNALVTDTYRTSPLCNGYTGVLSHILQRQSLTSSTTDDKFDSTKPFKEMMKCIPTLNGSYSYFISVYIQVLSENGLIDEGLDVLTMFIEKHPGDINGYRLLLKVLSMNGSDEDKMADALMRLAGLDPSSPLVLQLVQSLIDKEDYVASFKLILRFLDYPINKDDVMGWSLLTTIREKWPEHVKDIQWISRLRRWKKLHHNKFIIS